MVDCGVFFIKWRVFLFVFFSFLFFSPGVSVAEKLEGKVLNAYQDTGVGGLVVKLLPPKNKDIPEYVTKTDKNGSYWFEDLPESKYLFQILHGTDLVYQRVVAIYQDQVYNVELKLERFVNSIGMGFIFIEPNSFIMGSPQNEPGHQEDEKRREIVVKNGFFIQTTEVTQRQWNQIMPDNPSDNEDEPCLSDSSNCPAQNVSIKSIKNFIFELNEMENTSAYRLPNEKEWEYACRAGTQTPFNTGMCLTEESGGQGVKKLANFNAGAKFPGCPIANYADQLLPIAQYSPNPWGLFDMHGNVAEFCFSAENDLNSFSGKLILRGGAYNNGPKACRSASRYWPMESQEILTLNGNKHYGFRLVYDPEN
jgi:formylglycine-generating enzyme required for sulfatase activity